MPPSNPQGVTGHREEAKKPLISSAGRLVGAFRRGCHHLAAGIADHVRAMTYLPPAP